jgi:NhaP-type Na+/H+ or K+/H+ antiporter
VAHAIDSRPGGGVSRRGTGGCFARSLCPGDGSPGAERSLSQLEFVALLLAAVGPLLALAQLARVPETLLLFASGVAAAFVPGLPPVPVDPQLVLVLFLPPILYASTVCVSLHLLRFTLVSGVLFGAVLALATIAAADFAARLLLPGLP